MRVAEAMREIVKQEGGKARNVTEKWGIHGSQISEIINKGRAPRIETLIRMREALARPIDEILGLPPLAEKVDQRVEKLEREVHQLVELVKSTAEEGVPSGVRMLQLEKEQAPKLLPPAPRKTHTKRRPAR